MAIPEAQLEIWAHQGSITQSRDTYATVKRVLEATDTAYAGKSFEVFLQGSYGNDTNIYAESDVDVVIRLDDIYHYDVGTLSASELSIFNTGLVPGTYPYSDYKQHVVAALTKSFGSAFVDVGKKAIRIKPSGNRRSADIVVATQFRRYYSGSFGPLYQSGISFFIAGGTRVANYPKQHSANCTAKHQATNGWYKPMVRILKNMRGRLVEDGIIKGGSAPSYFLEGLLYNVPSDKFGKSYGDTFVAAMTWVLAAQRNTLICANEEHYLSRDGAVECWPSATYDGFINAAVNMWNRWP